MSTKMDERLKKAVGRTKVVWWFVMLGAFWYTIKYLQPWCMLLLIPFAFISYAILVYISICILAATVSPEDIEAAQKENEQAKIDKEKFAVVEDLAKRQRAGEEIPADTILEKLNAVGITDIVKITKLGPIIGTYKDKPIYEYIFVNMPKYGMDMKLLYNGPANIVDGVAQLPEVHGTIFACVENILYSSDIPVQSK